MWTLRWLLQCHVIDQMKLAYRFEGRLCDLALWFGFGLFREVAIIFYGDIMRLIILRIIGLGEY